MLAAGTAPAAAQKKHTPAMKAAARHAAAKKPAAPALDEQALKTQVMLDRAGHSPGGIDGRVGTGTLPALDGFTMNGGLPDGATPPLLTDENTGQDSPR